MKDCSHETRRPSRVVRGKIAIGERHNLREADTLLHKALAGGWLAAPALAEALGDSRRAAKEQARFADAPEV